MLADKSQFGLFIRPCPPNMDMMDRISGAWRWRTWRWRRMLRCSPRRPRAHGFGSGTRHDRYRSPPSARELVVLEKEWVVDGRRMRRLLRRYCRNVPDMRFEADASQTARPACSGTSPEPDPVVHFEDEEIAVGFSGDNNDCWRKIVNKLPEELAEFFEEVEDDPIGVDEMMELLETVEEVLEEYGLRLRVKWLWIDASKIHVDKVVLDHMPDTQTDMLLVVGFQAFLARRPFVEEDSWILVGINAADMVEASQAQNQGEIARQEANNLFNEELRSTPTVQLRMTARDKRLLQRRLGYEVRFVNSSPNYSGHAVLAAERALARDCYRRLYDRNRDVNAALHVGCTMHEIKMWWAHPGHDFLFNIYESKDVLRVSRELVDLIGDRLKEAALPSLTSIKGNTTRISNLTLEEAMALLETHGRRRIHFDMSTVTEKYNVLFFEDCMYNMTEEEFMGYFRSTGAKRAHGILFTPDFLVSRQAPRSELYYHEQVLPAEEIIREAIDYLWPEVLLLANFLPGHFLQDTITDFLKWLLKKGSQVLWRFLCKPLSAGSLMDEFFGLVFELCKVKPILLSIFTKVNHIFLDFLSDTKIAWMSGAGNGYRHNTRNWRKWIHQRRFEDKFGFVESEVREMHGEMWCYDFYVSDGTSPLTYTVSLPPHKAVVEILDVFQSYEVGKGLSMMPTYIPILAEDWYRILNWALAEPLESLDFGVMMTTVNRVRGGLKLGSNEIVVPMTMQSDEVKSVAMAALCACSQLRALTSLIEADDQLRTGYEKTYKGLAKMALKCGLTIVTSGLSVPIYFFVKWLLSETKEHEWYKAPSPPKLVTVAAKKHTAVPERKNCAAELQGLSIVLPHVEAKSRNPCMDCDLYERGAFSMTGRPTEGQQFVCTNHENDGVQQIVLKPDAVTEIIGRIRAAHAEHTTLGAGPKLLASINKMKEWFEGNAGNTLEHEIKVGLHVGGPGVGKSTCYRVIAKNLERAGKNVVIASPFSKLLDDYTEKPVIGFPGNHTFKADTFWWLTKESNVDAMLVDEVTNVDEMMLAAMCVYTGVKLLYLAGDGKQTHLNAEQGEGLDPLNETHPHPFIDASLVPTHTYIWNWRNRAGYVKLLNANLGYQMKSKSNDYTAPIFMTRAEYATYKLTNKIDREMVFSHASCMQLFGTLSQQNPKEQNHSVRSEQGMTHGTTALGVSTHDTATIEVVGMRCVAVSRQKDDLICVAENWSDPVPAAFREWMHCTTEADWEHICKQPWPNHETQFADHVLTRDQEYLDRRIRELNGKRKIRIEKESVEEEEDLATTTLKLEQTRGFVNVQDPYVLVVADEMPLWDTYRNMFSMCFFDLVVEKLGMKKEVYDFLERVYVTPEMGLNRKASGSTMRRSSEGKHVFFLYQIEDFCTAYDVALSLHDEKGNMVYYNRPWAKRTQQLRELNLRYKAGHVEDTFSPEVLPVGEIMVNPYDFHDGIRNVKLVNGARVVRMKSERLGMWHEKHLSRMANVGYEYLAPTGQSRAAEREPTELVEVQGVRGLPKPQPFSYEKLPHQAQKIRAGTDGYKLAKWIDPSDALPWNNMSEPHVVQPVTQPLSTSYTPEGLLGWTKTKAGKLKKEPVKLSRSFTKGMANVYDGGTVETLSAIQRLGLRVSKPELTQESREWCRKVAKNFVDKCMVRGLPHDVQVYNKIVRDALADSRKRNYWGRSEAERAKDPLREKRILVANKAQVKCKFPIDPMKSGQPLSMPNTNINLKYVPYFRTLGYRVKESARDFVFIDDYESAPTFAQRMSQAIAQLPDGVRFLIVDAAKFDSQQGAVTCYIEQCIHEELGADPLTLDEYYEIRRSGVRWSLLGRAKGSMTGNKPSGLPDTKLGNTLVEGALATYKYDGLGPCVVCLKGDDYLRVQAAIAVNKQHAAEIATFTGITLIETLADSGSFIGYAVSKAGVVPDVVKRTYKALAARARDYKHFCEHQISYRQLIEEIRILGGEEAAQRGAVAVGGNEALGSACWSVLNSLGHLGKKQWQEATQVRMSTVGLVPSVEEGSRLI